MKSINQHLEDLDTIKNIMDKSTRFLSLSGLSGVFAGIVAIGGYAYAKTLLSSGNSDAIIQKLVILSMVVLITAVTAVIVLSSRKARKKNLGLWSPVSKRLLLSMSVPLITGGILILLFISRDLYTLIVPSMLIFYGLSLVNAEKFTFSELFYLGILEIATGLVAVIIPEHALAMWVLGFGVLHIVYGTLMYMKYDR